jgi:hypothetical protein
LRHRTVILSEVAPSRSEAATQSKDPSPAGARIWHRREFSHRSALAFVLAVCGLAVFLTAFAAGETLTGTVKNGTSGKPSAGDEIVLLKLGQGMEEAGHTKADAKGKFTFTIDDPQSPHLVRAIHQGVTYHRMAPPGTTSVEVEVYDVAKKLDDLAVVADIMRVQAEKGELEVVRMFAVQNSSKPPRTQMNEHNLEFYLPEGAQVVGASAMTAGGQPVNSAPVPEDDKKTRYSFLFPLRPGLTQFQVAYTLPYTGQANLDPKPLYPLQHFVAMLPKAMQFAAAPGAPFQPMNDPNQPDAIVQVASNTTVGQPLAFKVSGEGVLQERGEGGATQQGSPNEQSSLQGRDARPGGGLGPPIDAPDPLQKYRWYILGGFAAVLAAGAVYVASKQQSAARAASRVKMPRSADRVADEDAEYEFAEVQSARELSSPHGAGSASAASALSPGAGRSAILLEALKEELFQLEVDRKQGNISPQEYEKHKAALDQTLERALKREAQKA